ncbi:CRISPR-associated protein Csx3 [Aerosakkonemataceae cyanobacterium BLCC-F154]|uniref:CRISPR-associated protein Csx3 n=1 Tax=Floridaenema fluviatile BLCC-F154 TaxID=3153640 RepID=A0ABV4Y4T7_9CYAN
MRFLFTRNVERSYHTKKLQLPDGIDFSQGIIIEGKLPIWLYGYLVYPLASLLSPLLPISISQI